MAPSVAVLGAGVVGVSTALALRTDLEHAEVTLIGAELTPDTTGDGSAGVWGPRSIAGPHIQLNKWGRLTHDFIHQLWQEGECPGLGIVSAYDVEENMPEPFWKDVPFSCTPMTERDLAEGGHQGKKGYRYVTVYAEPSKMLPFLMKRFRDLGGKVIKSRVKTLDELPGYDIIVNCTGIGARELVGDEKVMPVRGQVIKVHAPSVKNAKFSFPGTYVIPNDEFVVLGGTAQRGDWRVDIDDGDTAAILARCRRWIPSLQSARVERVWAGLRPFREGGVRLEVERRMIADREVPVVHNYGHGGSGVTMFWGCALQVTELVKRELSRLQNKSKL
ncbi:D-aspartate oxidase-like [Amphibalanus amphitrite]|uniref:D-aspartate oxidase-like n=1 Tax=Amphibalanus amphitrite TaxID=1232801 RepID=UPI001C91300D|nr:D-aspartate oxidase-like [Amphibalanus amphitrite]XP_043236774.1 D-aspartate oxidase-like [Amphibalanus amphitrite]